MANHIKEQIIRIATVPLLAFSIIIGGVGAQAADVDDGHKDCERVRNLSWEQLLEKARGQTVNWWMWAGDPGVNQYVDEWVAPKAKELFDITVKRVAIKDTVEGVQQVIQEKQAGKNMGSGVDLNWISSENLKTMIQGDLLCEGYQAKLPNHKYIDYEDPSVAYHGTLKIGDTATPWGRYQYVYVYNTDHVKKIPTTFKELAEVIKQNPGKFTYPAPPDFTGRGMLTNILYEVTGNVDQWVKGDGFNKELWEAKSCALWDYLNDIKPYLWRKGETYPENASAQNRLYASGELWFTIAAYHATPGRDVEKGTYPKSTKTSIMEVGTIAGTHNISIPYNSGSKEAAIVLSDFLIGPGAQYQKALPEVWGIGTVLTFDRLPADWQEKFRELPIHPASVPFDVLGQHQVPTPAHYHVPVEEGWREHVLKGKPYNCQ